MKTTGKKQDEKSVTQGSSKLKTDFPLSEKDEVKQSEEKMRKAASQRKLL